MWMRIRGKGSRYHVSLIVADTRLDQGQQLAKFGAGIEGHTPTLSQLVQSAQMIISLQTNLKNKVKQP